jgi:hypothetical protein
MAEPQPSPFDMVERLDRAMYGDPANHSPGLFDRLDALTKELARHSQQLERLEAKKPDVTKWTIGYITFCLGGIFAVIAILNNIPGHQAYNVPTEIAATIAVVLGAIALYFFLSGFGWLGKN